MTAMYPQSIARRWTIPQELPTPRVPSQQDLGNAARETGRFVFGFALNLLTLTLQLVGYTAFVISLLLAPFLLLLLGFPVMLAFGLLIGLAGGVFTAFGLA
jgi:hypothetical protein